MRSEFFDSSSPKGSRDRNSRFRTTGEETFFIRKYGSEFDRDERRKGRYKVKGGASTSQFPKKLFLCFEFSAGKNLL
jgi:hypothetical protein